ncbi:MAG: hypothetical protein V4634_00190 [Pseudomonadota bacterium]
MDIVDFVAEYVPSQTANKQYAVMAFDLNLQAHYTAHPPPQQMADFSFDVNSNSDSGPWCAPVVNYEKSGTLQGMLDNSNRFNNPGHIHPEELLMKLFDHYLLRYYARYRQAPSSVALYSFNSPCENCNTCLRYMPGNSYQVEFEKTVTIPHWLLKFEECYCDTNVNQDTLVQKEAELYQAQYNGDMKARTGRYLSATTAMNRAHALRGSGWSVHQIV